MIITLDLEHTVMSISLSTRQSLPQVSRVAINLSLGGKKHLDDPRVTVDLDLESRNLFKCRIEIGICFLIRLWCDRFLRFRKAEIMPSSEKIVR